MKDKLYKSNCLIQSIYLYIVFFGSSKIGWDRKSPSRCISFYCDVKHYNMTFRWRFRRKIRRFSNKGTLLFYGYRELELINHSPN